MSSPDHVLICFPDGTSTVMSVAVAPDPGAALVHGWTVVTIDHRPGSLDGRPYTYVAHVRPAVDR